MEKIKYRKININDSLDVLSWRNDECTRKMFTNSSYVLQKDHDIWFKKIIKDKNKIVWIFEQEFGQKYKIGIKWKKIIELIINTLLDILKFRLVATPSKPGVLPAVIKFISKK